MRVKTFVNRIWGYFFEPNDKTSASYNSVWESMKILQQNHEKIYIILWQAVPPRTQGDLVSLKKIAKRRYGTFQLDKVGAEGDIYFWLENKGVLRSFLVWDTPPPACHKQWMQYSEATQATGSIPISDYRNRRPQVFCKKNVLRNFTKFTGKYLC